MADDFRYSSKGWLGKASAGAVLGLAIAIAVTSIFAWVGPGGLAWGGVQPQLVMWLVAPLWALIASFCFLFRSGLCAWAWLGAASVVSFALLGLVRLIFGSA